MCRLEARGNGARWARRPSPMRPSQRWFTAVGQLRLAQATPPTPHAAIIPTVHLTQPTEVRSETHNQPHRVLTGGSGEPQARAVYPSSDELSTKLVPLPLETFVTGTPPDGEKPVATEVIRFETSKPSLQPSTAQPTENTTYRCAWPSTGARRPPSGSRTRTSHAKEDSDLRDELQAINTQRDNEYT